MSFGGRAQSQRAFETSFRRIQLPVALGAIRLRAQTELSRSQSQPALERLWGERDMSGQSIDRRGKISLIQFQAAEIKGGGGQVPVAVERLLVGLDRFSIGTGVMVGKAEMVPGLGILREILDCSFQRFRRVDESSFPDLPLALEQQP